MAKHGCCADKACNDRTCMELPAGRTCGDCRYFRHCEALYAHKATDTYCDFYPRRFAQRVPAGAPASSVKWCPECRSAGVVGIEQDVCPTCDGTGKVADGVLEVDRQGVAPE